MSSWLKSKQAAWGETLVFLAIGGIITYLKPVVGIPLIIVFLGLGIWLLIRAYKVRVPEPNSSQSGLQRIKVTKDVTSANKIYKILSQIQQRQEELAEEASKYDWKSYIKYYENTEHYKILKSAQGEREAVLLEVGLSLGNNPILERLKKEDAKWNELKADYDVTILQIKDTKILTDANMLLDIMNEGDRNWLRSRLADASSTQIRTPLIDIMKTKYHEMDKDILMRILKRIIELDK